MFSDLDRSPENGFFFFVPSGPPCLINNVLLKHPIFLLLYKRSIYRGVIYNNLLPCLQSVLPYFCILFVPRRQLFCSVSLHTFCSLFYIFSSLQPYCRCICFVPSVIHFVPRDFGVAAYILFPGFLFTVHINCSFCYILCSLYFSDAAYLLFYSFIYNNRLLYPAGVS